MLGLLIKRGLDNNKCVLQYLRVKGKRESRGFPSGTEVFKCRR